MHRGSATTCFSLGIGFFLLLVTLQHATVFGQQQPMYDVFKTSTPPEIDGQFSEEEWGFAPNAGDWKNRQTQSDDILNASFRALWDDENFYLLMRTEMGGGLGATFNDEGRQSIPGSFAKTWNVYWDPNVDGEDNEDSTDGYQYAVSIPDGVVVIPPPADELNVADFREAHVDTNWGNNGAPWSMFTQDPDGGGRGGTGVGSEIDNFLLTQIASNDMALDDDGSKVITEMQIPWENFDAADPTDDPARDFGLFHPVPPELGEEWFFTIGLIPSEGELPTWHVQTGGPFAPRPHGVIRFVEAPESTPCDFNNDELCDVVDIDLLGKEIIAGTNNADFDMNGDGVVNLADQDQWRGEAATENGFSEPYLPGDADLDGSVLVADLNIVGTNWQQSPDPWGSGDFNVDGVVDVADLNLLALNWQQSIPTAAAAAVPEPSTMTFVLTVLLCCFGIVRKQRR